MRVLRRALLLLGLLAGLFAMHGLAPADGTDVLATGPHQHPAALLAVAGSTHGLAAAASDPAVTDEGMPGHAVPGEAMPASAGVASSGPPSPGHGGHGSHLDGLCLAVLAGGVAFLLALAVLGRPRSRAGAHALLGRIGRLLASASPLRPPDLARLCVLRI